MRPGLRKFLLTAHVTFSVGWLGAVAGFLALALTGLNSKDDQLVRGAYLAMNLTGWFVIVPLSFGSLVTGLIQALGTPWGLFRHYWVLLKFLINILSTILLLVHMQPTSRLARFAAVTTLSHTDFRGLRVQLVGDAGAALLALIVATALSVYKPRAMTSYGRRKQQELGVVLPPESATRTPRWVYVFAIIAFVLLVVFRHLAMGPGHLH